MLKLLCTIGVGVVLGIGGGCSTTSIAPAGAEVSAGQYADAFQAARQVLRERRWNLDRVDAPQGVLTTEPRADPGIAKPWDAPPGIDQGVENLLQRQQRVVRVTFTPKGQPTDRMPMTDPDRDLVQTPTETFLQVRVGVERIERPGMRVSVDAVRLSSQTIDPDLEKRGLLPRHIVPVREDTLLAGEILREILARLPQ